mgnify:CR=1 FL=1
MKEQNVNRKVQIWQVIVLVEFITVIFLGLYASYQRATLVAQESYAANIEKMLSNKDKREKELSAKLLKTMALLQGVANELGQDKQGEAINNVAPAAAPLK